MGQIVVPAPRALALQALKIAVGYANAGVHEVGGNNRGDQVEFFQHMMGGSPGDPWCADFVSTCLVKAYAQLCGLPEGRADLPHYVGQVGQHYFTLSGYCPSLWAAAKTKGMAHGRDFQPLPGDLVLFDFEQQSEPHHVGFVLNWPHTIEGNTSGNGTGSQADGGGVYPKVRSRDSVFGFGHFG